MTDSTVSHCEEERKAIQEIDFYFDEYDKSIVDRYSKESLSGKSYLNGDVKK